jgi:hypothetical protein
MDPSGLNCWIGRWRRRSLQRFMLGFTVEALRPLRLFSSSSMFRHEHVKMHLFGVDVWMFACCGSILRGPLLRTLILLDPSLANIGCLSRRGCLDRRRQMPRKRDMLGPWRHRVVRRSLTGCGRRGVDRRAASTPWSSATTTVSKRANPAPSLAVCEVRR